MFLWAGCALIFMSAAAGALLSRLGWPFELFASLLPQIGAIALLYALSVTLLGRPLIALCAVLAAALCAYGAREYFTPQAPPQEAPTVRVLWANLHAGPDNLERAFRLAAQNNVDVLAFAEFPYGRLSDEALAAISGHYHQHLVRSEARYNVEVFTRLPVRDSTTVDLASAPTRRGVAIILETSGGPLRVVAIHPTVPLTPSMQRTRDDTTRLALTQLRAGGPAILVGDFNMVPWSPVLRDAAASRASTGLGSTWMSPMPVLGLPIDHALAAGGARIAARVGPGIGSDHLPLIVDITIAD